MSKFRPDSVDLIQVSKLASGSIIEYKLFNDLEVLYSQSLVCIVMIQLYNYTIEMQNFKLTLIEVERKASKCVQHGLVLNSNNI